MSHTIVDYPDSSTPVTGSEFVQVVSPLGDCNSGVQAAFASIRALTDAILAAQAALAALTTAVNLKAAKASNLSDLASASTARTNLGLAAVAASGAYSDLSGKPSLGTASTHAATDFALVANNLSDLASASSARTNLGLATVANTGAYSDLSGKPSLNSVATDSSLGSMSGNLQAVNLDTGIGATLIQIGGSSSIHPGTFATLLCNDGTCLLAGGNAQINPDGSASFANGAAVINGSGAITTGGSGTAQGLIDGTYTAVNPNSRLLNDTDGSTTVMSWGQGDGSAMFGGGVAKIPADPYGTSYVSGGHIYFYGATIPADNGHAIVLGGDGSASFGTGILTIDASGNLNIADGEIELNTGGSASFANGEITLNSDGSANFNNGGIQLLLNGAASFASGDCQIKNDGTIWTNAINTGTASSFILNNDGSASFAGGSLKISASGGLNLSGIPTSSSGLVTGDVWNNSGVLTIV